MKLRTYVSAERGRCAAVARAIRVHPVLVSQWASDKREVPLEHCAALVSACGGQVQYWDLRPTDWHRTWPMLIGTEGAPPVPRPDAQAQAGEEARDAA